MAIVLMAVPVLGIGMASPASAWTSGPTCPSGTAAITNISDVINNTTTVTSLTGNTQSGESVVVNFTVAPGCTGIQVSFVTYRAPAPTYDRNTASQQTVFNTATGKFNAGPGTLQVFIPAGFYQIDFVLGAVITQLGPASSHNYYGDQSRLMGHDNGGTIPNSPVNPACNLTAILAGPPTQLVVTVQDANFGLKSIVVTELINATVNVPNFTQGTAQAIVVTATKTDQTQTGYLGLEVTNVNGGVTDCDPPF